MRAAEFPLDEADRLRSLVELEQLDTPPDPLLDAITNLAASICGVPIALISLVDESRQWLKSAFGLDVRETPREMAFCAHAILTPSALMAVGDALQVLSGLKSHVRRRKRYLRKDGAAVHVEVHVSPMVDDNGARMGFITQVIDITAQLLAETRRLESEA